MSDKQELSIGVLQGSVLGPLLFLIYINNVPLSFSIFNTLFAEDVTISLAGDSLPMVFSKFNSEVQNILQWMKNNQLTVNWSKMKVMFLTKRCSAAFPKEVPLL